LALLILFSNMLVPIEQRNVFADGTGTWENPYTVAQAALIQDKSIGVVQGYVVGQPTATNTVITNNYPNDYAIALADNPGETDTSKMIYVQVAAAFRAEFGLKSKPENLGMLVKVKGSLEAYFTHSGIKTITQLEKVNTTPVAVTGIVLDQAELQLASGVMITITATVLPENASNKNVFWSTDNEACASVNNGIVKAEAVGTAIITAKTEEGAFEASCAVIVLPAIDKKAPVILNIKPESGQNTGGDIRPAISASYADESGVAIESVKVYLDEMDVTEKSNINENGFTYMPDYDLSSGIHKVKLVASDKAEAPNTLIHEWSFSVGKQEYSYYFGQLHSHTNLSDGQGTPDEAFKWARDVAKADFFAITDHSNWFDNDTKANINDGSASAEWTQLLQKANAYNKDGEFVAIGGFEMTWSGSTGGWGHINTYNTAGFETRTNSKMDLKTYYNTIAGQPQSISQLNHPGKTFGDFGDFGFYSPAADAVVKLIEVGNGEGVIRSSGYFPSYEYYTRALDKGWHVAPSNNQDNHKANWVTANQARTVVIAPSLTRESIYDAIRNMRVYATEDSNLQVMYKVNGQLMGSSLSNPEALEITIDINDPDSTDKIGKVSIISDGGQVVSSKTFDQNTAAWQLTLDPKYSYYYVRIDQWDKDIAVTAPVWTGEVVPVGISKVELSQNPQIIGKPVDITATVYNNSANSLLNAEVEFFKDSVDYNNKIGEKVISVIGAASVATAQITWIPEEKGNHNIYARMILNVNGTDKVFTESTVLEVVNADDVVKVVVDGGHYNQYVTGDYKDKIITLQEIFKDKKLMMVINNDELTAEDLENAKVLIITDPQSKDDAKYGLYKSLFNDNEVSVIKSFSDVGGSIIITSRADYNDKDVTSAEYQSAAQGNKVLQALGANLRFNDDEVIDKFSNGGQEFRLYFDDYTSSKYNLLKDIPVGLTYSAYSGCSVILKQAGDETKVDWLVMGHDTTEILDSDLQNDATPVNKGAVKSLAAEILPNGSKLIVAGTTFFSDFETAAGDNAYSNKMITEELLNWLTLPSQKTIAEVRVDKDKDGRADLLGKKFIVEGRVTTASKAAVNNTAFFDVIYVQDETGGITVFGVSNRAIPLGARVRVTGSVDQYDGDIELQISNETLDLEIIDNTIEQVMPKVMSTADSMLDENEGWLVKVEGIVKAITENTLVINDGTGDGRVYVNGYIGDDTNNPDMLGKWDKNIKLGDVVSIVGLASQDAEGHRIRVRNTAEIVKLSTPVTGISIDKTAATITINDTLKLNAKVLPVNATNNNIIWKSSNLNVATVDGIGVVKPVEGGMTIITAISEDGGFTASCEVTVTVPVTGIKLDKAYLSLKPGTTGTLKATILPSNATNTKLLWKSNNPAIASVNENGNVTAHKIGIAVITVVSEDGDYSTQCIVAVAKYPAANVRINKESIVIKLGKSEKLTAIVGPGNTDIKDIRWSTDSSIIELTGKNDKVVSVKALALGKAYVIVTSLDGGYTDICEVTIIK
jgi:uncharacterized protein YjdB